MKAHRPEHESQVNERWARGAKNVRHTDRLVEKETNLTLDSPWPIVCERQVVRNVMELSRMCLLDAHNTRSLEN